MGDTNVPNLSPEIWLRIVRSVRWFNDRETFGILRLVNKEICRAATPEYAKKCVGSIGLRKTAKSYVRFRRICSMPAFAPFVKSIYISTTSPEEKRIRSLADSVPPIFRDPFNRIRPAIESMKRYARDYNDFVESGEMFASLETCFRHLRMNGCTNISVQIWDDVDELLVGSDLQELGGFFHPIRGPKLDPDNILGLNQGGDFIFQDFYKFSGLIPCRLLVALARSGLSLSELHIRTAELLIDRPWDKVLPILRTRDNIREEFLCDRLMDPGSFVGSFLNRIDLQMFTPDVQFPETYRFKDDCALFRIFQQATRLRILNITAGIVDTYKELRETPDDIEQINRRHHGIDKLLNVIPKQHIVNIRFDGLVLDASVLVQFLRAVASTLSDIEIKNCIIYGNSSALKSFRLRELSILKQSMLENNRYNDGTNHAGSLYWKAETGSIWPW